MSLRVLVLLVLPLAVDALRFDLAQDRVQRSLHDLLALCLRHFPLALGRPLRLRLFRRQGSRSLESGFACLWGVLCRVFLLSNEAGDAVPAEIKSNPERNGLLDLRELGVDRQLVASPLLPLALHAGTFKICYRPNKLRKFIDWNC